jgi:hypothetical protein
MYCYLNVQLSSLVSKNAAMSFYQVRRELELNASVFTAMLSGVSADVQRWRPAPEKWCLLEIVCHLYDEEREDFRARVEHLLLQPEDPMAPIDPVGWVTARNYMDQDYQGKLAVFLEERQRSLTWLDGLQQPDWSSSCQHPKLGKMTASMILHNWLAHDYLHFRQITRLKYEFLKQDSGEDLSYAGEW